MMKKLIFTILLCAAGFFGNAQVTTMYGDGTPSYSGSNTIATSARFNGPYGVAYDTKGNWWISDQVNNFAIIIHSGVYYIREGVTTGGFQDGAGAGSGGGIMATPKGIIVVPGATSARDQIYLADFDNNAIRKIDSFVDPGHSQWESTVAGAGFSTQANNYKEGVGKAALFHNPTSLGYIKDVSGGYLVVVDQGNNVIRKISLHKANYGTTSLLAGIPNDSGFIQDDVLLKAGFSKPEGIFIDAANNNDIYIAESYGGIRKISNGMVTTLVHRSHLNSATSVVKKDNNLYIADGCRIIRFNLNAPESGTNPVTIAGNDPDTVCDFSDSKTNSGSLFNQIASMTLSSDGSYLIIADQGNNRIRKMIFGTSAVEDVLPAKDMFTVYPNPAYGHVQVKSDNTGHAVISLVNMSGKQVCIKNTDLQAGIPFDMNVDNQVPGVYLLQVSTDKGVYSSKIIIR
jgi:hypothetical protein